MPVAATASGRARAIWWMRLGSAFRTATACAIVGCTTLYGPASLRSHVAFPAFSYVTAILIVPDATLGDTLRGCWHALCATILVVPLSMLSLWVVGPGRFTANDAALAVALSSFLVALPESIHMMSKRIAFGQIVIAYVGAVLHAKHAGAIMHPLHVASSTVLGALASFLALLLPCPRLAYYQLRKLRRLYLENASERICIFVSAFSDEQSSPALERLSQVKPLNKAGIKLLQDIRLTQEGLSWERPLIRFLQTNSIKSAYQLDSLETSIRGMEIALTSCPSFPIGNAEHNLNDVLLGMGTQLSPNLEQLKCFLPLNVLIAPDTKGESLESLEIISLTPKHLSLLFLLFCLKLVQDNSTTNRISESAFNSSHNIDTQEPRETATSRFKMKSRATNMIPSRQSLVFAFKCSLSLGLAVLFGLTFNKENGFWSGLTIAISFVAGRQPIFTVANARAQGTAIGSVYGVIGCFVFQNNANFRLALLLPWIIFTGFLRHSQMYGQGGGTSAVIGALLILGRKNYGTPDQFAIARLTEAFIGLFCYIMIELLLQPRKAASLAKNHLLRTLRKLDEYTEDVIVYSSQIDDPPSAYQSLTEKQNILNSYVKDLEIFNHEAQIEPDFWFLPFHGACYAMVQATLLNMVVLLYLMAYSIKLLQQMSQKCSVSWRQIQEYIGNDLELLKKNVSSLLKWLEPISQKKSLAGPRGELKTNNESCDPELGGPTNANSTDIFDTDEGDIEKDLNSFFQHLKEITKMIQANEGDKELKGQITLYLGALGFCVTGLMRHVKEIEKGIKEMVQWENPSNDKNFHEIFCKIDNLYPP